MSDNKKPVEGKGMDTTTQEKPVMNAMIKPNGEVLMGEEGEAGREVYNSRYKYGYNWGCYTQLGNRLLEVMRMVGCADKKIIDIGCGVGWFTNEIYFNVSRNVRGIDFSDKAIDHYARLAYPSIEFYVADIYECDYSGYEVAVLTEVLEHLDRDKELLARLPKGCKVFATVPLDHMREDPTHRRIYQMDTIKERYGDILDVQLVSQQGQFIMFWGLRK